MTSLGTFNEGFLLCVLAVAAAVLGKMLGIDWLENGVAPAVFALALGYMGGGSAGKTEAVRKLTAAGLPRDSAYITRIVRS